MPVFFMKHFMLVSHVSFKGSYYEIQKGFLLVSSCTLFIFSMYLGSIPMASETFQIVAQLFFYSKLVK